MVSKGERINWEIGTDIYIILYIRKITNNNLLYCTGNSIQYSVMTIMGTESKKSGYMIHFAVQYKLTQHCKSTILQQILNLK